ncbi:hypothetical protein PINS_up002927 [Pythium insidiosum]|nr:hypothetical protein PINS_up002925 [Pythium insidiosum]GLD94316.1 hypothetical protein PINS_up002927 [Pythium insidiosum]
MTKTEASTDGKDKREPDTATAAATGAGVGAGVGFGLWAIAGPAANAIGFGAGGIAAGSTAASMMSAAAVANGGGVAAGSAVAVLQSIGAVGLATPVGLGLVATGAAVGGVAAGIAHMKKKPEPDEQEEVFVNNEATWVLLEWECGSKKPKMTKFESETIARSAYNISPATKKELHSPKSECVERRG